MKVQSTIDYDELVPNKHRGSADGSRSTVGEPRGNISRIRMRGDHPLAMQSTLYGPGMLVVRAMLAMHLLRLRVGCRMA